MSTPPTDINTRLGAAVVIVEQNIPATLSVVDRVVVLKSGRMVGNMPAAEFAKRTDLWEHFETRVAERCAIEPTSSAVC